MRLIETRRLFGDLRYLKKERAMVTVKHEYEILGCLSFAIGIV